MLLIATVAALFGVGGRVLSARAPRRLDIRTTITMAGPVACRHQRSSDRDQDRPPDESSLPRLHGCYGRLTLLRSEIGVYRRANETLMPAKNALGIKRRAAAHPSRPGERCNAPAGTWAPVVDHGRCEAKEDCVIVCPNDVFEVRAIEAGDLAPLTFLGRLRVRAHGNRTAYTPRADQCHACGLCVVACPEKAIALVRTS